MRRGSPVLSAGRRRSSGALSRSLRSLRRSLLQDMNLCYRLLRQLVPGLPSGRAASRVEILQHVIDYILDLQNELDASCPAADRGELLHRDRPQSDQGSGTARSFQEEEERQSCSAGLSRSTSTVRRL